ncbi:YfcC family protein [Aureitalea sp. L0-47]|uniref:YfcC family protein n=1 Tax=Aureitalea sp. L0-47 TaxID=2816962 RepID=UPI002236F570|nr:SLC13 family permease [Aureitalea sp. L0-47]MCW5521107.1 YfcC family protein [Aureitalea sp. L0-47]
MKKLKFPTAQTILLLIAGLVTLLTWVVPAGQYDTLGYDSDAESFVRTHAEGTETLPATQETLETLEVKIPVEKFTSGDIYKPINIPGTYREVEAKPQGFGAFIQSPVKGIIESADIIFLVLFIGGLIGIMNRTGAFDAGISWLARVLRGREYLLIILVTTLIAAGGTTFGLAEETMAFYPILIPVFIAAGYDAMVGLACIFLGSAVGSMCSTVNPFSTIIASDAAGINWTSGWEGRAIILVICVTITILYILRYAARVKKDPSRSIIFEHKERIEKMFGLSHAQTNAKLTGRLRLIIAIFSLSFIIMVIGVSMLDWWFVEMTATFLVGAILIGIVGKIKESDFVEAFSNGAGALLGVAFIIGIARGVSVIMTDGLISDTMLYNASGLTTGMEKGVFSNAMFLIYNGLSFFIPSSSGMAVLTMPIMAPLADTAGVAREVVVNAYMYGMGLFFFINPTGLILAALAIVKVGFNKWLKFIMPLFWILLITLMGFLTISVYI